jgi:hypothetical protein
VLIFKIKPPALKTALQQSAQQMPQQSLDSLLLLQNGTYFSVSLILGGEAHPVLGLAAQHSGEGTNNRILGLAAQHSGEETNNRINSVLGLAAQHSGEETNNRINSRRVRNLIHAEKNAQTFCLIPGIDTRTCARKGNRIDTRSLNSNTSKKYLSPKG